MADRKRPGVMFYFDIRPSLKRLSLEEKGRLFDAVLSYGESGEIPDFEGMLGVAWDFIQPQIDRDAERYQAVSETRRNAANARWGKNANASSGVHTDADNANAFLGVQMMPTPITTSFTTPSTTPSAKEDTPAGCDGHFERFWEAYPRQVGRDAAAKAFAKVPKTAHPLILPALERQKQSRQWQEDSGRYIPNPAKWLSEARWNDQMHMNCGISTTSNMPTAQDVERMKRLRDKLQGEEAERNEE